MKGKRVTQKSMVLILFFSCWIVYYCTYLGRLNYSSAMAEMIASGFLLKAQGGFISTLFFASYAVGQLINGFLGDRISPKKMIFVGLLLSGSANLCMGLFPYFAPMSVFWAINGYAQAMVWPPIVRIFTNMLKKGTMVKCFTNISPTIALGTLSSYLLSAIMISKFGWQWAFLAASFVLLPTAAGWFLVFGRVEKHCLEYGELDEPDEQDEPDQLDKLDRSATRSFISLILNPSILLILLPTIVHGALKDGVTSWVPTYISEIFNTSPVSSVLAATILPVVNISGAYLAHFVRKRFFASEIKTTGLFFCLALLALVTLYYFAHIHIILTALILSVITSSMLAINTTIVSFVPMHFAKVGRASSMSGFLNATAYLGSALSSVSIGFIVSNAGWSITILSWIGITLLALVLCIIGRRREF